MLAEKETHRLPIKGIQKTSLIDYPPYASAVIFIGGCNFRCPYCHNTTLVIDHQAQPTMDEEQVVDMLVDRKAWLDAVVITGGEPTLYPDLKRFVRRIKEMGLKVKLDTNGTNPDLVWDMLDERLLDYIAMDIKAPLHAYEKSVMMPVDVEKIQKSISLVMNSGIDYEFRTTVTPKLIGPEALLSLVEPLKGAKRFVIQQCRTSTGVLDEGFFKGGRQYTKHELGSLKRSIEHHFDEVQIRD